MKTDKTKLLQDIEAMKEKLASMEEELNKTEVFKHFPRKDDIYWYYYPYGEIDDCYAEDDKVRPNVYKTEKEAQEAYNKAVALEKVKRRLLELQGDWKPNWKKIYTKHIIFYCYDNNRFDYDIYKKVKYASLIPYLKTSDIANTIIKEMEDELKLIFDIAITM